MWSWASPNDGHGGGSARGCRASQIARDQAHFIRDVVGKAAPPDEPLNRGRKIGKHRGVAQYDRKLDRMEH
jgi:hypothetical protein